MEDGYSVRENIRLSGMSVLVTVVFLVLLQLNGDCCVEKMKAVFVPKPVKGGITWKTILLCFFEMKLLQCKAPFLAHPER